MRFDVTQFIRRLFGCAAVIAGLATTCGIAAAGSTDYTPSLDITPTATFATGDDEKALPGGNPFQNGDVKFNFLFTQPLAKNLTLQLQQDRTSGYDVTIGSAGLAGGALVVPGSINDAFEEIRLNYGFNKYVSASAGYNYRWRVCCPNAAQSGNLTPTTWHGQFVQVNLSSPAIKALNGTQFTLSGHVTHNLWHNSAAYQASEAANGITPNGGTARFPSWYGLKAVVPLSGGLLVYGFYGIGAFDYFDNTVSPYYYHLADYGLVKPIDKYLTFQVSIDSLSQYHLEQNNPFLLPNGLHRAYAAASLDIHIGK